MFVNGFPFRRLIVSVVLVAALSFLAYPVYCIPSRSINQEVDLEAVVTRGVPVSFSILFLIILKEFWEIYVYVFSQWTMAWMLCEYIMSPKLRCSLMRGVVRLMRRLSTRGRWDQQVGQYNLLIQCPMFKLNLSILRPSYNCQAADPCYEGNAGLAQGPAKPTQFEFLLSKCLRVQSSWHRTVFMGKINLRLTPTGY